MVSPREIIDRALASGRNKLLEHEAMQLLESYSAPIPGYGLARDAEEAVSIAEKIGYPVVLKIVSPQIIHKSDVGGVVVGLNTPEEVKKAFNQIIENTKKHMPNAQIEGILVQAMAPKDAIEVVIGGIRDPVFGPTIMFGLGGIFVELFKDVSFRVAPFTEQDAEDMIREVKAYKMLKGYRNMPPRDIKSLIYIIMKAQKILVENPEISEMDLNPVMSYPDKALIVDARFILKKTNKEHAH